MTSNHTICAVATAPGGAIGIVRVSGADAISITDEVFSPAANGKRLLDRKPYTIAFGNIVDGEELIDEVLVSVFRSPHSYTGEDSVEISCHGSSYILKRVVQVLINHGCMAAEPGEFTRRAFMNGKIDLSQAEAVADLINATNSATHKIAMSQLRGHFSTELSRLREQLLKMNSLLELELDFSDHEELEFANRTELMSLARKLSDRIEYLENSFKIGKALKDGIPVAIVGKTNVGKSTLLNSLLHDDKAIVSNMHGTTRDVIEDTTIINGLQFRFIDTAGIRNTDDVVERMGIELAIKKLSEAAVVLWVIDKDPSNDDVAEIMKYAAGKKMIVVRNKIDMENTMLDSISSYGSVVDGAETVCISAKTGRNIDLLESAIVKAAAVPQISENDIVITSARHYASLLHALESIHRVIEGLNIGLGSDLVAEDLRITLDYLSDITGGKITSQETLNNIFKHFCIGK